MVIVTSATIQTNMKEQFDLLCTLIIRYLDIGNSFFVSGFTVMKKIEVNCGESFQASSSICILQMFPLDKVRYHHLLLSLRLMLFP